MRVPQRHDKRVALLPFQETVGNLRDTAAAKRVIDNGARMTMRFRVLTGPEKLYGASDGRQSRPAGQCIAIFEQIAVEGISFRGILC